MEYLSLEDSKRGVKDVLIITNHFTRFAVAIPTRNQTSKVMVEALYNTFITTYGYIVIRGVTSESKVIEELCRICNIDQIRTTPCHPAGNGQTEV